MMHEKADQLGTLGPKAQPGNQFRGSSFSLIYPTLGTEEADNLEMPIVANEKKKMPNSQKRSLTRLKTFRQ